MTRRFSLSPMRSLCLQIHRYAGLAMMVFLMLAAVTGSALVFTKALDSALNPDLFFTSQTGPAIPVPQLIARLQIRNPDWIIISAPLDEPPGRAVEMSVATRPGTLVKRPAVNEIFVDPHTSVILGMRTDRPGWDRRHIMRGIYDFHSTLLAGVFGRWLMGVAALGWVLINLVGLYLTLPRVGPFWTRWRPLWQVNFKARLPRLLLDLHRASGLWLFVGVMAMSLTSLALNFYSEAFLPIVRALSPPVASPWDIPPPSTPWRLPQKSLADIAQRAVIDAERMHLHLRPAAVTYDIERRLIGVRFTGDGKLQYEGLGPVTYDYDDQTGRLIFIDNPLTDSWGQKVLRSLFPVHSGQVAGLSTQLLVFLLGLSVVEMSVSGLLVWWKKRGPRVATRRSARLARLSRRHAGVPQ